MARSSCLGAEGMVGRVCALRCPTLFDPESDFGQHGFESEAQSKRQIDQLKKEVDAATGRVAALWDEVKRHELIYDMLDGGKLAVLWSKEG